MKATYQDFINENNTCVKFEFNRDAIVIFDFLNQDENIIKMAEYADNSKPALAGCVEELEKKYKEIADPTINLNRNFDRTIIGRMVKTILRPFGYTVTKQKNFPKNVNSEFFASASSYELSGPATMKIVKKVEEI